MEKVGENLLLFCCNLPANGAQIFWDTLYITKEFMKFLENSSCHVNDYT